MKVLVVSDSHGCVERLRVVVEREAQCETVVFLGDGLSDLLTVKADIPDRTYVAVRGNCDVGSAYDAFDETAYRYIEGQTILATHGHLDGVRASLARLGRRTAAVRGTLALFGHTHCRTKVMIPGTQVLAVNPGALCGGQYAVLDITPDGVETRFLSVE